MARVIADCVAAVRYYIYAAKPHLTWMDKKLGFFVGVPGTHTSFFNHNGSQMQSWAVQAQPWQIYHCQSSHPLYKI